MNKLLLSAKENLQLKGEINLTGSKSESNRALILQYLYPDKITVNNLSEADDTTTLQNILKSIKRTQDFQTIDVGPAGTAMRFLTAFLSVCEGNFILTGSERMQQRPIGPLVDALKDLGAEIGYGKNVHFPPLIIRGKKGLGGKEIHIDGSVSSQYLSACLLIAAILPNGIKMVIENELTSRPYLKMTLDMLAKVGIDHHWENNVIDISPQTASVTEIYIEPDWSAASYWYSLVALSADGEIFLKGLKRKSLQGDIAIVEIMESLGVKSEFDDLGVTISKTEKSTKEELFIDFKECPDLAQTVIVCAAALGQDLKMTGLETLKIKETNRVLALQNELAQFNVSISQEGQSYYLKSSAFKCPEYAVVKTYEDHRMAMAFAPLVLKCGIIMIEDPEVTGKSYPDFWKHLSAKGISLDFREAL